MTKLQHGAAPTVRLIDKDSAVAHSADLVQANIARLRALFPDAFTEGRIDFEVLKSLLGAEVDEREEKYGLNWHGKRRARQLALTPSTGTLRPCPEESVNWDTAHGLLAWSLTTLVTAASLSSTIGSIDRTAYLNFDFPCRIATGLIHR